SNRVCSRPPTARSSRTPSPPSGGPASPGARCAPRPNPNPKRLHYPEGPEGPTPTPRSGLPKTPRSRPSLISSEARWRLWKSMEVSGRINHEQHASIDETSPGEAGTPAAGAQRDGGRGEHRRRDGHGQDERPQAARRREDRSGGDGSHRSLD